MMVNTSSRRMADNVGEVYVDNESIFQFSSRFKWWTRNSSHYKIEVSAAGVHKVD